MGTVTALVAFMREWVVVGKTARAREAELRADRDYWRAKAIEGDAHTRDIAESLTRLTERLARSA